MCKTEQGSGHNLCLECISGEYTLKSWGQCVSDPNDKQLFGQIYIIDFSLADFDAKRAANQDKTYLAGKSKAEIATYILSRLPDDIDTDQKYLNYFRTQRRENSIRYLIEMHGLDISKEALNSACLHLLNLFEKALNYARSNKALS